MQLNYFRRGLTALVPWMLLACSAAPAPAGSRGTGVSNASPAAASGAGCTSAGPAACYCDDGELRGTQNCLPNGTLTPCACTDPLPMSQPMAAGASASAATGSGALCPELSAKSGCMAQSYRSTELPANVLFVLDRSGSMTCNPPPLQESAACEMQALPVDGTQPSKWQITVKVLEQVFDDLVAQQSTANIGLTYFSNDNTCGVQSTPSVPLAQISAAQASLLKMSLDNTVPSGGTPLVGATTLGYAYLHQEANLTPGCAEPCGAHGNRYVVLITDGTDSCPMPSRPQDTAECMAAGSCTDYLVTKAAPLAAQANIKTFVIGAPGSEPARGYLSELAFVGGTARSAQCVHDPHGSAGDCHFDMTTSQDFAVALSDALAAISGAAIGCDFAVPATQGPVDAGSVNVQYTPAAGAAPVCFTYDERPCGNGANGWQFATKPDGTQDRSHVVICGAACDRVRADPSARVDVLLGCETIVLF